MDAPIQRLLTDKLYEKRKQGALELERLVREAVLNRDQDKLTKIIDQLCHDYAYAVHAPYARNGGLIGLAAASIALGPDEVARHLKEIIPPVLACFTDQDARVRYYACEAMYNISKVAKGEVLIYFNLIFDALCKLASDTELSVKNGAELLDRLIKDIVSESAAHYISMLQVEPVKGEKDENGLPADPSQESLATAFSLPKFIPLLEERIYVLNPFTRQFLVSWLTILDKIPDLELVHFVPSFLAGLFKFLGDQNRDVFIATSVLLNRLLDEIVKIARIKRSVAERRKSQSSQVRPELDKDDGTPQTQSPEGSVVNDDNAIDSDQSEEDENEEDISGDYLPGQDVEIDHAAILDILLKFVDPSQNKGVPLLRMDDLSKAKEEEIGMIALKWIATFFEIASGDILAFVPRLLGQVLPALASQSDQFKVQAHAVNNALREYVIAYEASPSPTLSTKAQADENSKSQQPERREIKAEGADERSAHETTEESKSEAQDLSPPDHEPDSPPKVQLDYNQAVSILQEQLSNPREETRNAAIAWLRLLHRKEPEKVLVLSDGTFPMLLKTLADSAEAVVTQDLALLSQLCKSSSDDYFTSFMISLLDMFSIDRRLLEIRGNLIIRQLCINLDPERIYRTFADCIQQTTVDVDFASIMVQNLNNNLITAPELAHLRSRLRHLDTNAKEGQTLFVTLFKAWSYNPVATFSLCLLAQAYEQAYALLQIFADIEMTVNMLIQIDKLVQLLESPVFTYLRVQLLEPEKYIYLYKCLYGILMLLPQSSAFAALKNRLNSVSSLALLTHPQAMPPSSARTSVVAGMTGSTLPSPAGSGPVTSRLQSRRGESTSDVKWPELLENFKKTQEAARKRKDRLMRGEDEEVLPALAVDVNNASNGFRVLDAGASGPHDMTTTTNPSFVQSRVSGNTGSLPVRATGYGGGLGISAGATSAGQSSTQVHQDNKPHGPHGHRSKHSIIGKLAGGIRGTGGASKDKDKAAGSSSGGVTGKR